MNISSDAIRGYIDLIILALIIEQDRYGYEISKEISKRSNEAYQVHEATLYSAFKRLEQNGYIEPYYREKEGSNRKRKYYKITNEGIQYYQMKEDEWIDTKQFIDLFTKEVSK